MKQVYSFKKLYGENQVFDKQSLIVEDGKFGDIVKNDPADNKTVIDYSSYTIIPGIIDIHNHGIMGYSATCSRMDELHGYTKGLAGTGVTGVLATTQELDSMSMVADFIHNEKNNGAEILGIQAEGPYRAEKYMGASKGFVWEKPSLEYTKRMWDAAKGELKYMSISTELDNLDESIEFLKEKNVVLACGHTGCRYEEMRQGIAKGIKSASHFGNSMRPIHQRDAGTWGALLLDPNVYLELNADHVHVCKETIDIFFRIKNLDRFILISDSSELAGLPKGRYFARGRERNIGADGSVYLDDGTISGGGKSVLCGIKNLVDIHGLPLETVLNLSSKNPAELFNIYDHKGSIKSGKDADFVIIDGDFNVIATYVGGVKVYDSSNAQPLYNKDMKNLLSVS